MPALLIWRWQCVVCRVWLKVIDIMSHRDKHADRIIQLNCNRTVCCTFFWQRTMLTSCSPLACVACLPIPTPHYPAQLWVLWTGLADPWPRWTSACGWEHRNKKIMQAAVFFSSQVYAMFQTSCFPAQIVRCQWICEHKRAASLTCPWVKKCAATVENRRLLNGGVVEKNKVKVEWGQWDEPSFLTRF